MIVKPHAWGSAIAQAAALQLIAVAPAAHRSLFALEPVLEYGRSSHPFRPQLIAQTLQMVDCRVAVPDGPAPGVAVERSVLKAFRA